MELVTSERRQLQQLAKELNALHADLIDDDRLEEWPELFATDCSYTVIGRENFDTFGLYRSTQIGKSVMDVSKRHSLLCSIGRQQRRRRDAVNPPQAGKSDRSRRLGLDERR